MKIESVDFFYLAMPVVTEAADGSQDALLVRVTSGAHQAGANARPPRCPRSRPSSRQCRMAPAGPFPPPCSASGSRGRTTSPACRRPSPITAWTCFRPPIRGRASRWRCGICSAGAARRSGVPASGLCESLSEAALCLGAVRRRRPTRRWRAPPQIREAGFRAAKFGWAPFGELLANDILHIDAAREGLGPEGILLIDAGQIFGEDVEAAALRLDAMERNRVTFFEEPFPRLRLRRLSARFATRTKTVRTAGGEAAHNRFMAEHLIEYRRRRLHPDRLRAHRRPRTGETRWRTSRRSAA